MNIIDLIESEKDFEYLMDLDSPYTIDDRIVPRVTHILSSMINEEYIIQWANSLGFKHKSYKATLNEAADRGSLIHDAIHKYLTDGTTPESYAGNILDEYYDTTMTGFKSFKLWLQSIPSASVMYTEKELICPWFAGTADLIMYYNNKTYLLDFKTGKHLSFRYFIQLAAYRYILQKFYNIQIDCVGIIQLDKSFISYKDYILDLSSEVNMNYINQCTETFFSLLNAYRYRINNEIMYSDIF